MFSYILFYKKNYLKIILFSVFISLITYSFSYGDSNILSSEEIIEDAKIIMNKADKERWPILKKSIKNKNFQTLMHLSNWIYFQKNTQKINFEDLKNYYEEYKSWPASNNILLAIEKKIDWYDKDQKKTLLWMDNITPISVLGKIKVADKMIANIAQDDPQALDYINIIRENWIKGKFDFKDEEYIHKKYSVFFSEKNQLERLNKLIWNKNWSHARRQIKKVNKDHEILAIAKIKLARRNYGVDKAVSMIPKNLLNDEGLVYERVRWRRISNLRKPSLKLLKHYLSSVDNISHPDKWWVEINWHTRKLLDLNEPEEAYSLLKNHKQISNLNFSNAEWLLGWIALKYLNDPVKAKDHFMKMSVRVKMPISLSRAYYWLGRSEQALGNKAKAEGFFKEASQFNSTYYGLIANEMLPISLKNNNNLYSNFDTDNKELPDSKLKVLMLLSNAQEQKLSRKFISSLIKNSPDNNSINKILKVLQDSERTDLFIIAVKNAIKKDLYYQKYLFPFPNSLEKDMEKSNRYVSPELLLAVAKQESEFYFHAKSRAGALGLLQVMPGTAKIVTKRIGIKYNKNFLANQPGYNIQIATNYLQDLLNNYNGSIVLSSAAYNAGPNRVNRWIKINGNPSDSKYDAIDWIEKIPFKETRNYVQRIIENYVVYQKVIEDRNRIENRNIIEIIEGNATNE